MRRRMRAPKFSDVEPNCGAETINLADEANKFGSAIRLRIQLHTNFGSTLHLTRERLRKNFGSKFRIQFRLHQNFGSTFRLHPPKNSAPQFGSTFGARFLVTHFGPPFPPSLKFPRSQDY